MPGAIFTPWRKRRRSAGPMVPAAPAAPDTPSTPSPANTATAYFTLLSWVSARATKFDIYLDTVNPPTTIVQPKYNTTSYVPTLAARTTYYWKIVAFNDGGSATGPVWSFTTPAATSVLFSVGGSIVTSNALWRSLSITDALGPQPNTASLTFDTTQPTAGQAIRIGLGTLDDDHLLFGGEVQDVDVTYVGTPNSPVYPAALIDQTFRINQRRPFGSWINTSATTIAKYLVATFSTGFTSNHVQDGLPTVSINFDGSQDFMTCMRALATAISNSTNAGKTKVDYAKDVWLYLTYAGEQPNLIDTSHPPLAAPSPIRFGTDLSQIRTRVYGKGHGEALLSDVGVNETMLPIANAVMFTATGGKAIASITSDGAQSQILTYGGVQSGGSGSLVGPGTAPSTAPTATLANGTGIESGVHVYAYTDVTASGESLPSPLQSVTTGTPLAAPPTAPFLGTGDGAGVDTGSHDYAVTFVTAVGETTPSAIRTIAPGPISAPASGPSLAISDGAGVDTGSHDYAVTFVTAVGETTASPIKTITTGPISAPASGPALAIGDGVGVDVGSHNYAVTFITSAGETTASPTTSISTGVLSPPGSAPTAGTPTSSGSVDIGAHDYEVTFITAAGETTPGPASNQVTTSVLSPAAMSNNRGSGVGSSDLTIGDVVFYVCTFTNAAGETTAGTASNSYTITSAGGLAEGAFVDYPALVTGATGRRIYRNRNGAYGQAASVSFAGSGTFVDNGLNWNLGAIGAPPGTNTADMKTVPLTSIPTGNSSVTSRKVYRRFNGAGTFKLLTTIADNTTTTYTDTTANASLGVAAPSSNTALRAQISLTSILTGPSNVTSRKVYRTIAGGSQLKLLTTLANNTATTYLDTTTDASLGANVPVSNTALVNQVSLTSILAGPSNVTSRKVYRTAVGFSQLKLLTTIADNTTTTYTDVTADASLGANVPTSNTALVNRVFVTAILIGIAGVTARKLYRTAVGFSQLRLLTTIADNTTASYTDTTADSSLGPNAPTSNTALMNQVSLSGIAAGPSPTTSRKVYRTAAGASQLKLLTTLGDNTTTTFADATADSALGANAPTGDTSALTQVSGQVLAGATSMQTSSAGPFSAATGGWATAGSQTFRYTSVTGNTLIGIPASGPGAIVATVNYGSQVVAAPVLTDINSSNGVNLALAKGSSVNIWVQREDLTAQAALGLLERDDNGNPSDGIREYVIADERSTEATMIARCDADLAIFSRPVVTATYYTRDSKTKSGRTASISLPGFGGTAILTAVFDPLVFDAAVFLAVDSAPFAVYTTFTIQSVAITVDAVNANPLYHVTASSVAFTLNDLLRRVALTP